MMPKEITALCAGVSVFAFLGLVMWWHQFSSCLDKESVGYCMVMYKFYW